MFAEGQYQALLGVSLALLSGSATPKVIISL